MSKIQRVTFVIIILAIVLVGLCVVIPVLQLHLRTDIRMFSDMSECDSLENLNVAGGHFTKYSDTTQDNNLDNLQYTDYFAGKYSCDQYEFEIFAYEFADPMSAKAYFENATGKKSDAGEANYSMVSGLVKAHIIAYKGNMAYAVNCPSNDLADVSEVLVNCFRSSIRDGER